MMQKIQIPNGVIMQRTASLVNKDVETRNLSCRLLQGSLLCNTELHEDWKVFIHKVTYMFRHWVGEQKVPYGWFYKCRLQTACDKILTHLWWTEFTCHRNAAAFNTLTKVCNQERKSHINALSAWTWNSNTR